MCIISYIQQVDKKVFKTYYTTVKLKSFVQCNFVPIIFCVVGCPHLEKYLTTCSHTTRATYLCTCYSLSCYTIIIISLSKRTQNDLRRIFLSIRFYAVLPMKSVNVLSYWLRPCYAINVVSYSKWNFQCHFNMLATTHACSGFLVGGVCLMMLYVH